MLPSPSVVNRSSASKKRFPSGSPSRVAEDARMWMEWKTQLTAYIAWVNSQLKKKPGAHLVEDLRHDVRDGVALLDLLEVIAGEKLPNTNPAPSTNAEMVHNVDAVLQFMVLNKVKMHHITTRDIVEGNLKAIMRLILSLAVHYKPKSVRHSTQQTTQQANITGIAQGAAAALTEARRNVTRAGHRHRRRKQREEVPRHSDISQCSDSEDAPDTPQHRRGMTPSRSASSTSNNAGTGGGSAGTSQSQHRKSASMSRICNNQQQQQQSIQSRPHRNSYTANLRVVGEGRTTSPTSSPESSPRASLYLSDPPSSFEGMLNKGNLMMTSCESDALGDSGVSDISENLKDTRQMLVQLHELLLNGDSADPAAAHVDEGLNPQETISILKNRLLHTEEVSQSLRSELAKVRQDCLELQGIKTGLQERLSAQDSELSETKSALTSLELTLAQQASQLEDTRLALVEREQTLVDMKATCLKQAQDREAVEAKLRSEVISRDHHLAQLQQQHHDSRSLPIQKLSPPLRGVTEQLKGKQDLLTGNNQDNGKIASLSDYLQKVSTGLGQKQLAELETVSQHLQEVRAIKHCAVPLTHSNNAVNTSAIDSLEESIVHLLTGLHLEEDGVKPLATPTAYCEQNTRGGLVSSRGKQTRGGGQTGTRQQISSSSLSRKHTVGFGADTSCLNACGIPKSVVRGQGSSPGRGSPGKSQANHQTVASSNKRIPQVSPRPSVATHTINKGQRPKSQMMEGQTNAYYYTPPSTKPSSFVIHKKIGEVCLGDFKSGVLVENPNVYQYFFKVFDPEYGSVKEQVFNDEDILPAWEGKIVAWLEAEGGNTGTSV